MNGTTRWIWVTAAAFALAVSGGAAAVAQQAGSEQQVGTAGSAMMVTAGDIADDPEEYYGKTVTVRAEVEDVLAANVFLLDEEELFAWPDVLVIAPKVTGAIPEDEMVTVTGTVRSFVEADFQRDYDWTWWGTVDRDIWVTYRDRPVIIADSVKTGTTELIQP